MNSEALLDLFQARTGLVCAVGAGGKKSVLYQLLRWHRGRVALAATVFTTRFPESLKLHSVIADPGEMVDLLAQLPSERRFGLAAPSDKPGRHAGLPPELIVRLHRLLALEATFVKADGARMRLLKAPKPDEPVVPRSCDTVIAVLSAQAIGRPLDDQVAHRVERISEVTGLVSGEIIQPQHLAQLFCSSRGVLQGCSGSRLVPVINMVDDAEREALARDAAERVLAQDSRFERVLLTRLRPGLEPRVVVVERG